MNKVTEIINNIEKIMVGKRKVVEKIVIALLTNGHVLIEDVPGVGKTQCVSALARSVDGSFKRIQFTPDVMASDITGFTMYNPTTGVFEYKEGSANCNFLLADEINRATPKTQSALLEAMGEKSVTVGKVTYDMPKPFMVLATQNPIEQEGTYPLPEAQLDRFQFKVKVDFPSLDELSKIIDLTLGKEGEEINSVLNGKEILEMKEAIREIPIADPVKEYALKIILATHPEVKEGHELSKKYVEVGASPRAAQGLISGAKVKAVMEGRYNVSFDDIKYIAYPVLRHRIILNFEGITEGITEEYIIEKILEDLRVV